MGQIIRFEHLCACSRPEDEEAPPERGSSAQEMRQRLGTRGSAQCDGAAGERRGRQCRRCQRLGSCQCPSPALTSTAPTKTQPGDSPGAVRNRGEPSQSGGGGWGEDAPGVQGKVDAPVPAWAGAELLPRVLPLPGCVPCLPTQNLPEEPTPKPVTGWASRGARAEPCARPRCHIPVVATGTAQPGPLFP